MVFGWGRKKKKNIPNHENKDIRRESTYNLDNSLQSREYDYTPQHQQVSISDVHKIISDLDDLRASQTVSDIQQQITVITPLIEDLVNIGHILERDDLNVDDLDKHLAVIVIRGKKQVIDVIRKSAYMLPGVSSIHDAQKAVSDLGQMLKKIGDVLGRQTRVIHIFAKKYANSLKENLEVMNSRHSEMRTLLKNHSETKSSSDQILADVTEIKSLCAESAKKVQKLTDTKTDIQSASEKADRTKESISVIKSSNEYTKYLETQKSLDALDHKKDKIHTEINSVFSKISRPLGRYEYGSSLDKEQKMILSSLVSNPSKAILPKNHDDVLLILENVSKAVKSGSISVKDIGKALTQIMDATKSVDVFIGRITEHNKEHKMLELEIESLRPSELDTLEREYAKTLSLRDDLKSRSHALISEIQEINSRVPHVVIGVQMALRRLSNTLYDVLPPVLPPA